MTAEVTPHHLLFTDTSLRTYDTNFRMAPPLRTEADRLALVEALKSGVIDCIATDHAPHSEEDKNIEFARAANGAIGFETAFSTCMKLVEEGALSFGRLNEAMTFSPARVFGFKDRGQLKAGLLADLAVLNISEEWVVDSSRFFSKSRNTPFNNWKVKGRVQRTVVGGRTVFDLERGILD